VHPHNDFAYGPLTVVNLVWLVGWVGFHGLNIPAAFPIFRFFVFSFYNMAGHHGVVWLRAVLHSWYCTGMGVRYEVGLLAGSR